MINKKLIGVALVLLLASAALPAHEGEEPLTDQDIAECAQIAKGQFERQYGTWLLDRVTTVETVLIEEGAEVEIRIHYVWGAAKFARYFCGYEMPGRLGCERAFSGPGAL